MQTESTKYPKRILNILFMFILCLPVADGQNQSVPVGLERTAPELLPLIVDEPSGNQANDLTARAIRDRVELRLREDAIAPSDGQLDSVRTADEYLFVHISQVGTVFDLTMQFNRKLTYPVKHKSLTSIGTTWEKTWIGNGDAKAIMGTLDQALNTFLNDYLKANPKNYNTDKFK